MSARHPSARRHRSRVTTRCVARSEAHAVDEVKDIRDKVVALEAGPQRGSGAAGLRDTANRRVQRACSAAQWSHGEALQKFIMIGSVEHLEWAIRNSGLPLRVSGNRQNQ